MQKIQTDWPLCEGRSFRTNRLSLDSLGWPLSSKSSDFVVQSGDNICKASHPFGLPLPLGSFILWAYWCPKSHYPRVRLDPSTIPHPQWNFFSPRRIASPCFTITWEIGPMKSRRLDYQQFGSPQGTAFLNAQEIACTSAESFAGSVAYHVWNGQGVQEELPFWWKAGMGKKGGWPGEPLWGWRYGWWNRLVFLWKQSFFVSNFMERVCCINFCNEFANIFIHSWMSLWRFSFYRCKNISGSGELAFPFSCAFLKWVCQYSDTRKC